MSAFSSPLRALSELLGAGAALLAAPPAPDEADEAAPTQESWLDGRTQQLWCEPGEHDWARLAVRGRKPTACPRHR